jgi:NTE family protein
VQNIYYYDGGLRLNTPLTPAVSLGASRILIIGTQHRLSTDADVTKTQARQMHYPSLGETLGEVYHSILLDRLRADREQVQRINRILDAISKRVSPEVYGEITDEARVQKIEALSIFPSVDIASLVDDTVRGSLRNLRTFSALERAILRFLETDPKSGANFLSYFLFEPSYLRRLIDLGFHDARKHHDELAAFAERAVTNAPLKM